MPIKPKRIVVTGGAGFIGSHLVERLLSEGHFVICVDSFFSSSKENIFKFMSNPRFDYIRHDITHPLVVECDEIYHLACPASPVHYQFNAIKTIKTNIIGTTNMCGLAKRVGGKILLASTSEVYGDPEVHPQPESYVGHVNCLGRRACYDEGKRVAETVVMDYHRQHNLDTRIVRIFNTYGPNMQFNDGRVVSNFIVQGLRGDDLTLYGDGSQTRSFCYVSDLVDGLIRLMNASPSPDNPEDIHYPVNIGNPTEFTIRELAEFVCEYSSEMFPERNRKLSIVYRSLPSDDPKQRQPDITRAKTLLNWEPKVKLKDGLKLTFQEFKDRFDRGGGADVYDVSHQEEAKSQE